MVVKKIITHENPDIDAALSVLLLKRFGEEKFPGVATAEVSFYSAGKLPEGKTTYELENEGILAVDIGGGRFDTHPTGDQSNEDKRERCAADLVAEAVGVLDKPGWAELIEFTRQHDTAARNIQSRDYIHHLPTFLTILAGLAILYEDNPDLNPDLSELLLDRTMSLLETIPIYVEKRSDENVFDGLGLLKEMVDQYLTQKGIDIEQAPSEFESFVEWRHRLHEKPEDAFSNDPFDEMVSLSALVTGLWYTQKENKEQVWKRLELYFDAIIARETQWANALSELDENGHIYKVGKRVHVVSIASKNGMVIKAARFRHRADIVVYREPKSGATSFIIKRNGPLKKFSIANLAAKVRTAECVEANIQPDYPQLKDIGMVHGWFVHQSENLLIRGSQKADDFVPSQVSLEDIAKITISEVDWQQKIPTSYCPDEKCVGESCWFYKMHFPTCKNHRQRCNQTTPSEIPSRRKHQGERKQPQTSAFGAQLLQALQPKSKSKKSGL